MSQANPFSELPPLEGNFSTAAEHIQQAGQDFGKIVMTHPIGVLKPKHIKDIINMIQYAQRKGLKILPRGMSHSAFGQCQCNGGIVIDMTSFSEVLDSKHSPVSSHIYVEAGCTWNKVIQHSLKDKYAPAATTDWQFLTVGGTLSTGGVGFMSYRKGLQADNVLELDVVTGNGEVKTCSMVNNHELFHAVRGGLGQFGVIARAKIKLEPAPSKLQVFQFFHTDSQLFFSDIHQLVEQNHFEYIHAFVLPNTTEAILERIGQHQFDEYEESISTITSQPKRWIYFTELVKYAKSPTSSEIRLRKLHYEQHFFMISQEKYIDYVHKDPPLITAEKKMGKLAHPELTLAMPSHAMPRFMDEALSELTHEAMGGGTILLIPMLRDRILTPLFQTPEAKSLFFLGFLRNAQMDNQSLITTQTNHNLTLYHRAKNFGGKRYPCDSIPEPNTLADWQQHFGKNRWQKMRELKYEFDPHHLFVSNLNIFG